MTPSPDLYAELFRALEAHDAAMAEKKWEDTAPAFAALCKAAKACGWGGGISVPRLGIQEVPTVFALRRLVAAKDARIAELEKETWCQFCGAAFKGYHR